MLIGLSSVDHSTLLLALFVSLLSWWLPYRSWQNGASVAGRHEPTFTVSHHWFNLSLVLVDDRSVQDGLLGQDLICLLTDAVLRRLDSLQDDWVLLRTRVVFDSGVFLSWVVVEWLSGIVVVVGEFLVGVASLGRISDLDIDLRNARLDKRFLIFLVFRIVYWVHTWG